MMNVLRAFLLWRPGTMEERGEALQCLLTLDKKEIQVKALDLISKQGYMRLDRMTGFLIIYQLSIV